MSIFKKLIVIFLSFIIIPVMFVGYMVFYNSKKAIEKEVFSRLNVIADQDVGELEMYLAEGKSDIFVMGHRDIFKTPFSVFAALDQFHKDPSNPSYREAKKMIDERFEPFARVRRYVDMELVNLEGRVIYVTNPKHGFEFGELLEDKDAVFQKIKTSGIHFQDARNVSGEKIPHAFYLTGPVYGDGDKVIGLVRLGFDLSELAKMFGVTTYMGESWEELLVEKTLDNKVIFLTSSKLNAGALLSKAVGIGDKEALPAQKAVLGESGSGLSIDYRGKEVLAAWRPLPSLGWGLVVKVDREEAFLPIEKLLKLLFAIALMTIFIAALSAYALAKSISDPIHELRKGAEIIGAGNLDYKIGIDTRDEVGRLSQTFDVMSANLKESTVSIEDIKKEIIERRDAEEKLNEALIEAERSREIVLSMLEDNNRIREELGQSLGELKSSQAMLIQSEKLASLGKLISEIAHEVNNPLMVISGNAQLSLMSESLDEEVKANLRIIAEECMRAKGTIQRLLRFSKPSKGKVTKVDINKSLETIVEMVEQVFKLEQIEITRDYLKDLPLLEIDEPQVQEVFMNLINNAKDAMPGGGRIAIATSVERDFLRIDFKDSGSGIPDEVKTKVFEPFFTTKDKGTGLGLPVCYGIVKAHGGDLKFDSEVTRGTIFTLRLPLGGGNA